MSIYTYFTVTIQLAERLLLSVVEAVIIALPGKEYTQKYKLLQDDNGTIITQVKQKKDLTCKIIENTPVYKALKEYRYKQSQKENIKPYFIYNNAQLEEIIKCNPKTLDELKKVYGFGDVKCQKYGKDILLILGDFK